MSVYRHIYKNTYIHVYMSIWAIGKDRQKEIGMAGWGSRGGCHFTQGHQGRPPR